VHCFPNPGELASGAGETFYRHVNMLALQKRDIHIAFSGGSTPAAFFDCLAAQQGTPDKQTDWSRIHLWWVDERCVPHSHPESNVGMTQHHLLQYLPKNGLQVHPIHEGPPRQESARYENEIREITHTPRGIPEFDWIFLGMGEDGHTASIFPDRPDLLDCEALCAQAAHPVTQQMRITMTGRLILAARRLSFLVTGAGKAPVIRMIFENDPAAHNFPAFYIARNRDQIDWYLDQAAAATIKSHCHG